MPVAYSMLASWSLSATMRRFCCEEGMVGKELKGLNR
jgi:hypothetical protein